MLKTVRNWAQLVLLKFVQTLLTLFCHGNRKEKNILDFAKIPKLFWEEGECVNHEASPKLSGKVL